jgi:hypothetical protein
MVAKHEVADQKTLRSGTRVRLIAPSGELRLRTDTGTVVGPDRYEGSYIVHLDEPARYSPLPGQIEEASEIVEDGDNLAVLPWRHQPFDYIVGSIAAKVARLDFLHYVWHRANLSPRK